ncbi:MAG: biopolymer transporter ExbD [Alphaproteobacteria bacterium]|jgi:biopolymer transport protein ExbD|nr:biopolymer transporter ExbD [Alphaproteobacteria bacterium]MDP6518010.1 biopolymer transporter ExbD [Alphaproteobacteria bacterium]
MNFADHERPHPKLNITPLIDVVFLLLVFFMMASSFTMPKTIDLALPRPEAVDQKGGAPLLIRVAADGSVTLDGLRLPFERLQAEVAGRVASGAARTAAVRHDSGVSVQLLVDVMDRLRAAGVKSIGLDPASGR